ncbi:MAG: sulfurtransferase-like selenium metabolism protein YedF [Calditrichaeota bacterium]|nr:sulfurtransferase-like selenium metabolism protein YedF [Calditrichota bacterium]
MSAASKQYSTAILITRNGMGHAEAELQQRLIKTYLTMLDDNDMLPGIICFYTDGVKLVVDGSPVLGVLKSLEAKGVHLIICNTCLKYFDLADKVQVGIGGGMHDIIEVQWHAKKVIAV